MAYKDPSTRRLKDRQYKKKYYAENPELFKQRRRAYVARNREQVNAKKRDDYHVDIGTSRAKKRASYHADIDTSRAKQRAYCHKHRPQRAHANRAYRITHLDHLAQANKVWRQTHREERHAAQQHRRALKRGAPVSDYTAAQWREQQEVQDHRCYYCGKRRKGNLTQDHIIPLSKGGSHTASNIVGACGSCNSRKHDKAPPLPVQMNLLMLAPPKKRKAS